MYRLTLKPLNRLIPILFIVALVSCKDDEVVPEVRLLNVTSSYDMLNDCDIGGSAMATEFLFELEFESSANIDFDGVEFDLLWSDGDDDLNNFSDDFEVVGNTVLFDWCFRYGTTEWFELDFKLLANGEVVESNEVKIRVDKPADAN